MRKTGTLLSTVFFLSFSMILQAQETLATWLGEQGVEAELIEDGLYYSVEEAGMGTAPKMGDYVMLHYTGKLLNGEIFDQSDPADPFVFQLGYRQVILGWEIALPKLKVGSKATLYVPSGLAYGKRGVGKQIPPNADLQFEVELIRVMDFTAYDQYMVELEEKERRAYEEHVKDQFLEDKKIINNYALANKLKTKRLPSGMSYVLTKKGKGDKAKSGDVLEVQYEGRLVDGNVFDSTKGKSNFRFTLGLGKVIKGWEEGLQQFRKGSEGWLLIPSQMAYGPMAIDEDGISIPGDAVLIFKVKVVNIHQQVANK